MLLVSCLKAKFHNHYLQIPTVVKDGHIVITQLPPKPAIDYFELELIKVTKNLLFKKERFFLTSIKAVYPELNIIIPGQTRNEEKEEGKVKKIQINN
jgi:hypothetical protein